MRHSLAIDQARRRRRLEMRPDSVGGPITLIKEREGVDTGEAVSIAVAPNASWNPEDTAFLKHLELKIIEHETLSDDIDTKNLNALPMNAYDGGFELTLKPGTGKYRAHMRLAREPHR